MHDSGPLHWMLRAACAAEFVGHGAFGIITKADWVPYFGVVGIPPDLAWRLMPVIGTFDITLGLVVGFIRPARVLLLYMAFWGFLTATLRPISGEPTWEFVERIPNWAIPLTFFCVRTGFERSAIEWLLRLAVAGALIGHGAYGAIVAKSSWFRYFGVLGISHSVVESTGLFSIIGGAEIALGLIALVLPVPGVLPMPGSPATRTIHRSEPAGAASDAHSVASSGSRPMSGECLTDRAHGIGFS